MALRDNLARSGVDPLAVDQAGGGVGPVGAAEEEDVRLRSTRAAGKGGVGSHGEEHITRVGMCATHDARL